jgi:hypothetical protein
MKYTKLIVIGLLLLSLTIAGCNKLGPVDGSETIPEPQVEEITDKEACEQLGGRWELLDTEIDNEHLCNLPTQDAGAECDDSSHCDSYCQASGELSTDDRGVTGTCYEWQYTTTGCMKEVHDNVVQPEWCE